MSHHAPSPKMRWMFLLSIFLMMVHKYESFKTAEWEFAPAYLAILNWNLEKGEMLFLTFITVLFVGLIWCFIIICWNPGQWIFLGFWGLTFLLEWHHIFRTISSGAYYSGLFSAMVYVIFGFFYWWVLGKNYITGYLKVK